MIENMTPEAQNETLEAKKEWLRKGVENCVRLNQECEAVIADNRKWIQKMLQEPASPAEYVSTFEEHTRSLEASIEANNASRKKYEEELAGLE